MQVRISFASGVSGFIMGVRNTCFVRSGRKDKFDGGLIDCYRSHLSNLAHCQVFDFLLDISILGLHINLSSYSLSFSVIT